MENLVCVVGYGPVGSDVVLRLPRAARRSGSPSASAPPICRLASPSSPATRSIPPRCRTAMAGRGADRAVDRPAYSGKVWRESWPKIMTNFVEACEASGARLVFFDNLYMYGPCTAPMKETNPLTSYGVKPAARSEATRIWHARQPSRPDESRRRSRARFLWPGRRPVRARRLWLWRARQGQSRL